VGNLVAAASGLACVRVGTFVLLDGIGLMVWATVYGGAGWLFSDQVEQVVVWGSSFTIWIVAVSSALIAGAGMWRIVKVYMHKPRHEAMRISDALSSGEIPLPT
jgi:membrane protein DedA with SNARE-associated domain